MFARSRVITAPSGSTIPDKTPKINDLCLFVPLDASDTETIAPSGKFWIAIPIARAIANEIGTDVDVVALANTIPTAIPSGKLCSATANDVIVDLFKLHLGPSDSSLLQCVCGIILSKIIKNATPSQIPTKTGINPSLFKLVDVSNAGTIKLQNEAAIITPAAKPENAFKMVLFIFLIK